jgi:hypothetical protein
MNYHVILASLGFSPSDKLSIHGDFTYTMNEGSYDPFNFSATDQPGMDKLVATGKWSYDWGTLASSLSDLKMNTMDLTLGANFQATDKMGIYAMYKYAMWEDEEFYIADGTGDYMIASAGLTVTF